MAAFQKPLHSVAPLPAQFQAASQVLFKTTNVDPPASVYIAPDDFLVISIWANFSPANIRLVGRLLRAPLPNWNEIVKTEGHTNTPALLPPEISHFDETLALTNAVRLLNFFTMPIAEGFLLSIGLTTNAVVGSGQYCYAVVSIGRPGAGATALPRVLFAGYLGVNVNVGWPDSQPQRPTDGAGTLRTITGTTPAAGAEILETVPTSARWSLFTFKASLASNATVINRAPQFIIDDGANILFDSIGITNQPAASVDTYMFTTVIPSQAFTAGAQPVGIQLPFPLKQGFRIRSLTGNLQAGDQWNAVQYLMHY